MSSNASLPLLLKQLKLVTIYQHLDEITQKAIQEGWGYHTYLSKLLGLEVNLIYPKVSIQFFKNSYSDTCHATCNVFCA